MENYFIKPITTEEALESWIWTNNKSITRKGFIIIENPSNGKTIKTFKRDLDDNYLKLYNSRFVTIKFPTDKTDELQGNFLIISEYYRDQLDIQKNTSVGLNITAANIWQKLFTVHLTHPNPTVQFANRATLVSIIVGVLAFILTIYSICITLKLRS